MNHYLNKAPDSRLIHAEKDFLYFGGTSYLGLQTNKSFQELLISNIRKLGANWGASRMSNVRLAVYDEFEKYLARNSNSDESLCVSSGYMAGQMLAGYFIQKGFELFCAPNSHPALIHHKTTLCGDYPALAKALKDHLVSNNPSQAVLFIDTVDFSGAGYPDFENLKQLPLENIILVADDSHGFGLIGENGFESYSILKDLKLKELLVCGSFGKALATPCGVILGEKDRLEDLRDTDFYAGGSPPSPAALKTLMEAEEICRSQRKRLRQNIDIFLEAVTRDFQMIQMDKHPVFGYNNEKLTGYLFDNKILTTNFRYPKKSSPLVSKIVLSAHHSREELLELAGGINSFFQQEG